MLNVVFIKEIGRHKLGAKKGEDILDIKDQLPYLGTEQDDGSLKINEHITINKNDWDRPDYDEFKSKTHQTEFECVNVLTGISNIDSVKLIVDRLDQKLEIKEKPCFQKVVKNPKWLAYFAFDSLMTEIRDTIDLGVKTGNLIPIDINDSHDMNISNDATNFYFNPRIYYGVLQFLNWMKKNSFPIHDELQLPEHKDGILYCLADETQNYPIKTTKIQENDIREIVFEYVDNTEIEITIGRNDIKTRSAGDLDFVLKLGRKTWDVLIEILKQPPHKYSCGHSKTEQEKTDYQRKYSFLYSGPQSLNSFNAKISSKSFF